MPSICLQTSLVRCSDAAGGSWNPTYSTADDGRNGAKEYRIVDQLYVDLKNGWSGMATALYSEVKDGAGNNVTATNANYLGQKVRYTGGTGTVNTTTGAATIQWSGTFTVNFYGPLVPFWITDPKLTVTPNGSATLTARMGGFASSSRMASTWPRSA